MKVRITRRAEQDIIDLYVYGAGRFGLDQAEHYHRGMIAIFDALAANPKIARLRQEFSPPVRLHAYQAHVIIYIDDSDGILIVRVLHGRQNWDRILS